MSKIDWNLARAFCATAETGSLSAAARQLRLTQPTLSRQVAALEAALGVTLFERIGRRLVLTSAGLGLLEHARAMASAADAFLVAAAGQAQDVTGRVSISATDAFSAHLLPDLLGRLRREAPGITIAVVATDSISDLRRREADIAIRHVRPSEPDLIGRRIGDMTAHFYAAEAWLARHGRPLTRDDLGRCDLLGFEPVEQFIEHLGRAGLAVSAAQCPIVSASAVVLWELVRRGLGVGIMLETVAQRLPGLVRLLPDVPPTPVPVWLVTHRELRTSRRVRLVFDVLAEELQRLMAGDDCRAVSADDRS